MNVPGGNKLIPVGEDGLTGGTGEEAGSSHVLDENPTHCSFPSDLATLSLALETNFPMNSCSARKGEYSQIYSQQLR